MLSAHVSASPSSATKKGDVADPRTRVVAGRTQRDSFWSQQRDLSGGMTVYFSIFNMLIISDRESIASFPREQKGEICLLWGFGRVRCWLTAKYKREYKMKLVWVWERTGQKESSSAFIPPSFLLLTQLSNYTQTCTAYYTPLLVMFSVWWPAAALILASHHCICNSHLQNSSDTRQDFYRSQGQKQLSPLLDTESIMNVGIIPWLLRNWCH